MEVEIEPPSVAQMRKLHLGHPFRAKIGRGLKLQVPSSVGKKLMKASMKGMGATVDSCSCMGCGMCGGTLPARTPRGITAPYVSPLSGGNVKATAKDSGKRLMVAGTDRAVRALEGSGKNKHYMRSAAQMALMLGNPASVHGGNVKATAKDSGKRLIVAGTDRAVRALEGSGYGGNVKATAKDSAKRLMVAGTDRAVRALEGSGAANPFVKQVKKQQKKQDQQKDELMKQMNQQMQKQQSIMKKAKQAQKTQSAAVNKELMQQVTQQVKKTKQLMSKAADLHEEAVDDAKADVRGQPTIGGKVNRRKKFDGWFKSIGSKFKTLNHNLKPIKEAATKRAVTEITYRNNPTAQAKALLDMAQEEFGDDEEAAVAPVATSEMMSQGISPEMLSQAVASKAFSKIKKVKQAKVKAPKMEEIAEAQPIDVNQDGEMDGYFYPREMSYFGAGMGRMMQPVPAHAFRSNRSRGKGVGEMGRPTIMPVVPFQRPVPVRGMGAKKSSPWIEHVKAYCKKHGCKYSDGLKQAKASYKKGGALYPAGYDPRYD
jgi:hypothetical protein